MGAAFFWFLVLGPLRAAEAGAAEVSYSTKAFILVPFCLVYGVAFFLLGERFQYRTPDHKKLTMAGWVTFAIGAALAAAGFWWYEAQFSALGYT